MIRLEPWHFAQVPRLGTVIVSVNALRHLERDGATPGDIARTLELGTDTKAVRKPYSGSREYNGIRLLLKTRRHLPGAAVVCIDGYRVKP